MDRPDGLSSEPTTGESNELDDSHIDNPRPVLLSSEGRNAHRSILVEFNNKIFCALNLVAVIHFAEL